MISSQWREKHLLFMVMMENLLIILHKVLGFLFYWQTCKLCRNQLIWSLIILIRVLRLNHLEWLRPKLLFIITSTFLILFIQFQFSCFTLFCLLNAALTLQPPTILPPVPRTSHICCAGWRCRWKQYGDPFRQHVSVGPLPLWYPLLFV